MNMKKWLLTGACISMFGAFSACSEDPSSPQEESSSSTLSSGSVPPTSSDGTSAANPNSSSAVAPVSSSIADTDNPQMGCSEIMYNAAEGSDLEWIEIYIAGGRDIDNMQNYLLHLSGAVDYTFPAEPLKKGEYVVIANDLDAFRAAYPQFTGRLFGPWTGGKTVKLPNEGDVVNVKISGEGDVSCAFGNEPPWPSLADGKGRTLVHVSGNAAQPNSWAASKTPNGNPGVGNDEWVAPTKVRINEIKPFKIGEDSWVEIYNAGDQAVDLTGWTLEVKRRKQTLTIKSGTVPPKDYLVLDAATAFDDELIVAPEGGELYLRGPQEGDESSIWVPASNSVSGIIDLSDGSTAQGPLATPTPGAANSALKMGSVYINEIHYHPDEGSGVPFEFVELVNNSDQDITLYSSTANKGWKVEGINLEFSSMQFPAKSMMLLIPAELEAEVVAATGLTNWGPDLVRQSFSIPETVKIVTYSGKLSNRSETIAVKEPYSREESKSAPSGYIYFYVWHDATLYSDNWPGLTEADGMGYSLQRVNTETMGYEASAWKAAEPTPGKL